MKKNLFILSLLVSQLFSAQFLVVGNDSISVQRFKEKNLYSLQSNGVEATLKNAEDFMLLQNFAREKKADTAAGFRNQVAAKLAELKKTNYFPPEVITPLLAKYLNENKTQKEAIFFYKEKPADDKTDYAKIYQDVVSGKISMEQAVSQYTSQKPNSIFIKPGTLQTDLYNEIASLSPGQLTKLVNNPKVVAFAKFIANRPSAGYTVYNSISYKNDQNAFATKDKIYSALKSGKKFTDVAAMYGSTEEEKKNGGLILGNPALPQDIYNEMKNLKIGDYTKPILIGDKYFIFSILDIMPYVVTEKNRTFYTSEMLKTNYQDQAYDDLINFTKKQKYYSENPDFSTIAKSYKNFSAYTKPSTVLYKIGKNTETFSELKKTINERVPNAQKLSDAEWQMLLRAKQDQDILDGYDTIYEERPDVKNNIDELKRNLYADFIFNKYLKSEIDNHPQLKTDYYNAHKNLFMWDERAKTRIAFVKDPSITAEVTEKIKNPSNWDTLKKQFYGKLTANKDLAVNFQEGETAKTADIFTKYGMPFKKGVVTKKIQDLDVVMVVDDILAPSQMSVTDADADITDALAQQKMEELTAELRAKTKITADKAFMDDLLKNFKK